MATSQVNIERRGRVMIVRLQNPPHNFMTTAMVRELTGLTRELEKDRSVGSVVITGAPADVFITHFDVAEISAGSKRVAATLSPTAAGGGLRAMGALSRVPGARTALERTPAAGAVALRDIHDLFLRMNRLDKVFVAAINGLALGGGCELALACDVRIMARGDHRIGLPEMTLGIIPGAGGTQRMSRLLGRGRALEMMLEARALTPEEATEIGLVHRTAEPERLLGEALATAERLARRSPAAVGALKRAVYEGASMPLEAGLHVERAGFMSSASTEAARKAMKAYAEQVERGERVPWEAEEELKRWQEGTAIDLT
jgi:enoyl-CoA hydratase/carnithine racemase